MTPFRLIYSSIGILISIYFVFYIFQKYEVINGLFSRGDISILNIFIFTLLYSAALILKPLRYYYILNPNKLKAYSKGFYIGNFLNLFIPFRIGDISRVFMFTDVIRRSENLKLILIEKFLDLGLMIFFLISVYLFTNKYIIIINYLELLILIIGILIFFIIRFKLLNFFSVIIISTFAWFIEGIAFTYFLFFVLDLDFLSGFSFMPITTLSTLIPSAPGYIGVINLAMISWAEFLDVSNIYIGSIAFEIYILTWICTFLFGLFCVLTVKNEFKSFLIDIFKRNIK